MQYVVAAFLTLCVEKAFALHAVGFWYHCFFVSGVRRMCLLLVKQLPTAALLQSHCLVMVAGFCSLAACVALGPATGYTACAAVGCWVAPSLDQQNWVAPAA
jgi:hypothetical protein